MGRTEMEKRRLKAAKDLVSGCSQAEISRRYSVSRTTACRWVTALNDGGSLRATIATGRPRKLDVEQMRRLREKCGDEGWTYESLADWICQQFGIRYHTDHVGRILQRMGFTKKRKARRYPVSRASVPSND